MAIGMSNMFYWQAVQNCCPIGHHVADFISHLVESKNASLASFHVIGHSMGAHIAGCAGHRLNGQLKRITGLDPAKPYFAEKDLRERIDSSDAEFVDIIHTCGGVVGIADPVSQYITSLFDNLKFPGFVDVAWTC